MEGPRLTAYHPAAPAVLDVERLARAMFIHCCPLSDFDAAASWDSGDSGKAARQSWIQFARNVIEELKQ